MQNIYLLAKPTYPHVIIPTYALANYGLQLQNLYRPKVAEIIFYHLPYTQINGEPAHGKHDLDSIM